MKEFEWKTVGFFLYKTVLWCIQSSQGENTFQAFIWQIIALIFVMDGFVFISVLDVMIGSNAIQVFPKIIVFLSKKNILVNVPT